MKNSKYILISIGIVCLVLLLVYACRFNFTATKTYVRAVSSSELHAVTMKQAITIAYVAARQWSKDAELVKIISTDAGDNPTSASGESGKRVTWNVMFTDFNSTDSGGTPASYNVFVSNGKITYHRQVEYGKHQAIKDSDLSLDSSDAVSIAKNQKGLKPGKDWAIGYHFDLEYLPVDNKNRLIMEVFGLSPKGNFAYVGIDEKTGKILDALEKTSYDAQGNPVWTSF